MNTFRDEDFKKIIRRRDSRYDGRFFFGVRTTHIYCRPICPARPLQKNIVIFRSASEAENQGYRPCLRCHPESAPESRILQGTANTVSRALKMMNGLTEKHLSLPKLAEVLGVTDRHLRRLFDEHLGASPIEILTSKRLHFSKQLLTETSKPMAEIALASGFQSVRRFNEAFKSLYKKNPTEFKKDNLSNPQSLQLRIPVKQPYDWNMVLNYLKRHECYGTEKITDTHYTRYISSGKTFSKIRVEYSEKHSALLVQFDQIDLIEIRNILSRLKNLFDTDHNPVDLKSQRGLRVPRSFSAFEVAISIILSQLVSTTQAKETLKKFIIQYGRKIGRDEDQDIYGFPEPKDVIAAPLQELGVTRAKAHAIRELSQALLSRKIELNAYVDLQTTREKLLSIKGIGPWTVEMIAMRCLGDSDAFPSKDLLVHRASQQNLFKPEAWISQRAYLTHMIWSRFSETLKKERIKK